MYVDRGDYLMNQKGIANKNKTFKRFIKVLIIIISLFIISILLVVAGITMVVNTDNTSGEVSIASSLVEAVLPSSTRERINAMILGTDQIGLVDVIMVVSFDTTTGRADVISIPRDTHLVMPPQRINTLVSAGRRVPSGGVMKFGEIHAYAGSQRGIAYTKAQAEQLLGLEIHHYARINLEAFRFIVDQIGGVEFYVPQRMSYRDPIQNLVIDLHQGLQILDGRQAEGLVRYRGYAEADIQRIRVQHDFILATIRQLIGTENIINNAIAIITATLNYVDTNLGIMSIAQYMRYVNIIGMDNIHFHVMPGSPQFINGISYIIANEDAIQILIDSIIMTPDEEAKRIQVLNGSNIPNADLAARNILLDNGFEVSSVGYYLAETEAQTRVFVRTLGDGHEIRDIFPGSRIVLDSNMDENYDIIVVTGMSQ